MRSVVLNPLRRVITIASVTTISLALAGCFLDDPIPPSPSSSIAVTPAKGAFAANTPVTIYRADSGVQIGTGVTDANGNAAVPLYGYTGPIIIKVSGGTGIKYFDEVANQMVDFGASDSLLAVSPSATASKIGVSPLTNVAAVFAGVSATGAPPAGGLTTASITGANTAVKNAILGASFTAFDLLDAPTPPRQGVVISSGIMGKGLNATASPSSAALVSPFSICSLARSSYAHSITNPNCTSTACAVESSSIV
jgi:hypothetical protein